MCRFSKKKVQAFGDLEQRKLLIDTNEQLSISKQTELLSINRSTYYYKPVEESEENLKIMKLMDEH